MNLCKQLFTTLSLCVSLTTTYGVVLHDTNLDKAFLSGVGMVQSTHNTTSGTAKPLLPEAMLHTHPEHAQLTDALKAGTTQPRNTPRHMDRRYLHQKRVAKGQHTYDGYRLYLDESMAM